MRPVMNPAPSAFCAVARAKLNISRDFGGKETTPPINPRLLLRLIDATFEYWSYGYDNRFGYWARPIFL